jgi:predicted transcriptional regulator
MHRLTHNQKTVAVKILKHLHSQPNEQRQSQQQIADAVGMSQSQVSRYLKIFDYLQITDNVDKTYKVGSKADKYLAYWAVYFMERGEKKN